MQNETKVKYIGKLAEDRLKLLAWISWS